MPEVYVGSRRRLDKFIEEKSSEIVRSERPLYDACPLTLFLRHPSLNLPLALMSIPNKTKDLSPKRTKGLKNKILERNEIIKWN